MVVLARLSEVSATASPLVHSLQREFPVGLPCLQELRCVCAVSVVKMVTKGGGCTRGMCECGCLWEGSETKVEEDIVRGLVKAITPFGRVTMIPVLVTFGACEHRPDGGGLQSM